MKKQIIIFFGILMAFALNAAEYAEIPMSVLMENEFENYDKDRVELEITVRDLEAKDKEIIYLKEKMQDLEEENNQLRKGGKKVKGERVTTIVTEDTVEKIKYHEELDQYTKILVRGGLKMGSTLDLQDADVSMGLKGDIEYIYGNMFFKGLELGAGIGFDYMTWENDNRTTEGAVVVGEPIATTNDVVKYETSVILIPMYVTGKYKMDSDNKFLKNTYGFAKLGFNIGMGGDVKIGAGTCYGLGVGKTFGNFGAELEYSSNSFSADYTDVATGEGFDTTQSREVDITNSKISLNVTYTFDWNKFFNK